MFSLCAKVFLVCGKDGEFDPDHQPAAGDFSLSRSRVDPAASGCRSWIPGKKKQINKSGISEVLHVQR